MTLVTELRRQFPNEILFVAASEDLRVVIGLGVDDFVNDKRRQEIENAARALGAKSVEFLLYAGGD